jgi:probable O-glycosylation ligase (exosortase A-associated)
MRDLLIVILVFGSVPIIFMRPWFGIIVWCWLGFMNPHRLTWGFAYDFPFAQLVAIVTLTAILFSREKKQFELSPFLVLWFVWVVWMNITTLFALVPAETVKDYDRTMKIQLFAFLTILLINNEERVRALMWVTVLSLGFFGFKGGVFSIVTGGNYLVWGPEGSFIQGNNGLGLALTMTIPLMFYLYTNEEGKWVKRGMLALMCFTSLAVLTTHSRGAFLALGAMAGFLWLKSKRKLVVGVFMLLAIVVLIGFMPEEWMERMRTISTYKQDGSAMGRINAWWFAFNLAKDNPITGGGFGVFLPHLFNIYAPVPEDFHDSHSIYFEVLGEHGFIGLGLFLALGLSALLLAGSTTRMCKKVPQLEWIADVNRVIQVSLIGYAVGGAFLGLAYFDLYYHLLAIIVLTRILARRRISEMTSGTGPRAPELPADAAVSDGPSRIGDRFPTATRSR